MEDMFSNLATYGYIALFLYSLGGGFVGLMAAGVLSYMGKMDLVTSMAVAMVSNFLGDTLLFYLARYHKHDVLRYFHKHRRKLALSHVLMKKHGSWIIFMQKFVYGIKTLIPLAIGITKYDFTRFSVLNFFAALLWALVVGIGSYLAGKPIMGVYEFIAERPYVAPIIILVLGGMIWFYLSQASKKPKPQN
ncbi:MAG TPA: DedA family protein [Sulfuricurvum sp.]|nr:DedA family protein [Sulfuricurvum sp.]